MFMLEGDRLGRSSRPFRGLSHDLPSVEAPGRTRSRARPSRRDVIQVPPLPAAGRISSRAVSSRRRDQFLAATPAGTGIGGSTGRAWPSARHALEPDR